MAKTQGPKLWNLEPYYAMGVDPKTGLPLKMGDNKVGLQENVRKILRVTDEQNALNRYTWYNLPDGLDGQLLERILYYRGEGMFFYMETLDKYFFLPYALDGTIDVYGRYTSVTPVPYGAGAPQDVKDGKVKPWIQGLTFDVLYDVVLPEDVFKDGELDTITAQNILTKKCVLLHDYSKQRSENIIPRQQLNDCILDVMADCIPFMHTALLNSTGVQGMRVGDQSEQANVEAANATVTKAALEGKKYVAVVGNIDFQDLSGGQVSKAEEFMLAMQSLDNFRLGTYGLENGGLFQKKQQMLQAEAAINGGSVGLVMQDGLTIRQKFCDIVNSVWGLGIWCDISENVIGMDMNGDMMVGDQYDQSGQAEGDQPMEVGTNE